MNLLQRLRQAVSSRETREGDDQKLTCSMRRETDSQVVIRLMSDEGGYAYDEAWRGVVGRVVGEIFAGRSVALLQVNPSLEWGTLTLDELPLENPILLTDDERYRYTTVEAATNEMLRTVVLSEDFQLGTVLLVGYTAEFDHFLGALSRFGDGLQSIEEQKLVGDAFSIAYASVEAKLVGETTAEVVRTDNDGAQVIWSHPQQGSMTTVARSLQQLCHEHGWRFESGIDKGS